MVYQVGQKLLYGVHGVCNVVDITQRRVDRKTVEYYELSPVEQPETRYYIPTANPAAVAKLHPIMTVQELDALLDAVKAEGADWIADENRRKLHYRELVANLDRKALFTTVSALLHHKKAQIAAGKKLHLCDENFLRDASKLIEEEFSLVLGLPKQQIGEYIQKKLED